MSVAVDADFGQLYQGGISSVPINGFHKLASHLKTHTPVFVAKVFARLFWNVVTKIENDWNLRQPAEITC